MPRTPSSHIATMEGYKTTGYFVKKDGVFLNSSGLTIANGIDLSQISTVKELVKLGIPKATAKKWKKLGVLGKTYGELISEGKTAAEVNTLAGQVLIPDTDEMKKTLLSKTVERVGKKIEPYKGKMSKESMNTMYSITHWFGDYVDPAKFKGNAAFKRKNKSAWKLKQELDRIIKEKGFVSDADFKTALETARDVEGGVSTTKASQISTKNPTGLLSPVNHNTFNREINSHKSNATGLSYVKDYDGELLLDSEGHPIDATSEEGKSVIQAGNGYAATESQIQTEFTTGSTVTRQAGADEVKGRYDDWTQIERGDHEDGDIIRVGDDFYEYEGTRETYAPHNLETGETEDLYDHSTKLVYPDTIGKNPKKLPNGRPNPKYRKNRNNDGSYTYNSLDDVKKDKNKLQEGDVIIVDDQEYKYDSDTKDLIAFTQTGEIDEVNNVNVNQIGTVAEPVAEPVTEPVVEPVVEPVAEPVVETEPEVVEEEIDLEKYNKNQKILKDSKYKTQAEWDAALKKAEDRVKKEKNNRVLIGGNRDDEGYLPGYSAEQVERAERELAEVKAQKQTFENANNYNSNYSADDPATEEEWEGVEGSAEHIEWKRLKEEREQSIIDEQNRQANIAAELEGADEEAQSQSTVVLDAEGNEVEIQTGPTVTESEIQQNQTGEQSYENWQDAINDDENLDKTRTLHIGENDYVWNEEANEWHVIDANGNPNPNSDLNQVQHATRSDINATATTDVEEEEEEVVVTPETTTEEIITEVEEEEEEQDPTIDPEYRMKQLGKAGDALFKGANKILDYVGGPGGIISYVMGKKGLKEAMKEVKPHASAQLSPMFMQHLRQSREIAKKGFHPDQARVLQKEMDGAYQKGLENAVRGSGGQRARFLASSGILDAQRSSALLQYAAQDSELQAQNQEKYEKLMMFKENFDIQQTEKERAEDMERQVANKKAAATFTSAAFTNLMSNFGGTSSLLSKKNVGNIYNTIEGLMTNQGNTGTDN